MSAPEMAGDGVFWYWAGCSTWDKGKAGLIAIVQPLAGEETVVSLQSPTAQDLRIERCSLSGDGNRALVEFSYCLPELVIDTHTLGIFAAGVEAMSRSDGTRLVVREPLYASGFVGDQIDWYLLDTRTGTKTHLWRNDRTRADFAFSNNARFIICTVAMFWSTRTEPGQFAIAVYDAANDKRYLIRSADVSLEAGHIEDDGSFEFGDLMFGLANGSYVLRECRKGRPPKIEVATD